MTFHSLDLVSFGKFAGAKADGQAHQEAADDEPEEHLALPRGEATVPENLEAMSLFSIKPVLEVEDRVYDAICFGVRNDEDASRGNVNAVFSVELYGGIVLNQGFTGIMRVWTAVDEGLNFLDVIEPHNEPSRGVRVLRNHDLVSASINLRW